MGGSAAKDDSGNGGFAADTGLVFTSINPVKKLEGPFFAIGIDVVAQGAAAMVDGAAENELDRPVQSKDLVAGEQIARSGGINAGMEERFIGVDVADAGQDALIEKGGLNCPASFGKAFEKLLGTDLERLGAEVRGICLTVAEPPDAAKPPG